MPLGKRAIMSAQRAVARRSGGPNVASLQNGGRGARKGELQVTVAGTRHNPGDERTRGVAELDGIVEPMELVLGVLAVGVLLGIAVLTVAWKVFSRAFDNGFEWLIHTFGNEQAAKKIEEKWVQQDQDQQRRQ